METNKFVHIEENFLPPDICDYYIDFINTHNTVAGTIESGIYNNSFKVSKDISLSSQYRDEANKLLPTFSDATDKYIEKTGCRVPIRSLSEITLRKYDEGEGFYCTHVDINPDNLHIYRAFVLLIYLNDVEEGGELVLPNHNICIKPKKGLLVIMPTGWTWEHEAKKVLKGDRYILRSFARMQ